MNALRFSVGFIVGLVDEYGSIATRNWILSFVKPGGSTSNGFDFVFDHVIRRRSRTRFRKGR